MLINLTYACKMGCNHCLSDCVPDGENMSIRTLRDVLNFLQSMTFQHGVFLVERFLNILTF